MNFVCILDPPLLLPGVFHPGVVCAVQTVEERHLQLGKFLDGEVTFVELPFHEAALDGLVDHGL